MNDASKLAIGQAHYSALLYPEGTFVDDVIVHKFSDNDYLLVINAGTREKDVQWVRSQIGHMPGVHVNDYSDYYTQLAIQGPRAAETMAKLTDTDLSSIKNYWFTWGTVCGLANTLNRSAPATPAKMDSKSTCRPTNQPAFASGNEVLEAGREFGILPCGLGARNTQRLAGVGDGSLWPRDFRRNQRLRGRSRPLLASSKRGHSSGRKLSPR